LFGAPFASRGRADRGVPGGREVVGEAARVGGDETRRQRLAQLILERTLVFGAQASSSGLSPALLCSSRRPLCVL
jgi:hypothetical protein